MSFYLPLDRFLGFIGIAFSFFGTIFMAYGGIHNFVRMKCDGDKCHLEGLQVTGNADIRKTNLRLSLNEAGFWLLVTGFLIQGLVFLVDP
jgi:hypothetical protein